jgi:hypothetical protein
MKLLQELHESEMLCEDMGNTVYITGVFMQAEITNGNQRIYPLEVLATEVARYNKEYTSPGRALGELKHPDANPSIDLDRASHRIVELVQEGNNFIGKALLLDTPCGNIAKGLIRGGVKLGVSSRGLGSVSQKEGKTYVNSDFRLITPADIVFNPSAPEAMVDAIMEEAEWVMQGGKWVAQFVEQTQEVVHKTPAQSLRDGDFAKKVMANYFAKLSKSSFS